MVENDKGPINKSVTGFDYGIAGVIYHRGDDEFSTPSLMVPNPGWSRGIHLVDNPRFIISLETDVVVDKPLDEKRTLEIDDQGNVIGVSFLSSKDGVQLYDLPISADLIDEARELMKVYHSDENPDVEDYWKK